MGFSSFVTKLTSLAFGLHWGDPDFTPFPDLPQIPLSASPSIDLNHQVLANGGKHDYLGRPGQSFCNTPDNRACWLETSGRNYDINTDYELYAPKGVTREYWVNVTYTDMAPDGFNRTGKLINGTYPGPLIEANWGDRLIVHVTNYLERPGFLEDNGTTIHWHGIRQLQTTESDGVNGVTQCPITPGESYTYNFEAMQYGHTWYHSHYSLQYPDGVLGPLLIHGPTSANWDIDLGILPITDYYHETAFTLFGIELSGRAPNVASSTLINGTGLFPCNATEANPSCEGPGVTGKRFSKVVEKGKRYLLRIVNTSTASQFKFTIDNHIIEVVQTDFVPIKPYNTSVLAIGIGQRYTVVLHATPNYTLPNAPKPEEQNFWIRTIPMTGCNPLDTGLFPSYGVLRYSASSSSNPTSQLYNTTSGGGGISLVCEDELAEDLVPILPWNVDKPSETDRFDVGINKVPTHGFNRWEIAEQPLWLDWGNPTIINLQNKTWDPEYAAVVSKNFFDWDWVYFIIQGNFNTTTDPSRTPIGAAHPIHLHGHDFVILAQGTGQWDNPADKKPLNLKNPARRDVAMLDANGYLVLAFRSDNPGIWLMHCHIAWHASSGLALQIVERQSEIPYTLRFKKQIDQTCKDWRKFTKTTEIFQDDSGV